MNVKELKELLAKYPDDMDVMFYDGNTEEYNPLDVVSAKTYDPNMEVPYGKGWEPSLTKQTLIVKNCWCGGTEVGNEFHKDCVVFDIQDVEESKV